MIQSRKARYITVGVSGLLAVGLIGGGVVAAQEATGGDAPDGERQFDGQKDHRRGHGRALHAIINASGLDASIFSDGFQSGQTVNEILAANDVDSGLVLGMVLADIEVKLSEKVADGSITQAEADEMLAKAEVKISKLMDSTPPPPGDRPHDRDRDGRHHRGAGLDVVADTIGISVDELRDALQDGSTIGQVADANGSSAGAVIDAMVTAATDRVDQAVADGKIDAEKADEIKSNLTDRITDFVNNGRPERPTRPADEA